MNYRSLPCRLYRAAVDFSVFVWWVYDCHRKGRPTGWGLL